MKFVFTVPGNEAHGTLVCTRNVLKRAPPRHLSTQEQPRKIFVFVCRHDKKESIFITFSVEKIKHVILACARYVPRYSAVIIPCTSSLLSKIYRLVMTIQNVALKHATQQHVNVSCRCTLWLICTYTPRPPPPHPLISFPSCVFWVVRAGIFGGLIVFLISFVWKLFNSLIRLLSRVSGFCFMSVRR
jgi:hypothetical protein